VILKKRKIPAGSCIHYTEFGLVHLIVDGCMVFSLIENRKFSPGKQIPFILPKYFYTICLIGSNSNNFHRIFFSFVNHVI